MHNNLTVISEKDLQKDQNLRSYCHFNLGRNKKTLLDKVDHDLVATNDHDRLDLSFIALVIFFRRTVGVP